MTRSASPRSDGPVPGRRLPWRGLALALSLLLSCLWGCQSFWQGIRERERQFSLGHAREQLNRGNCERGLVSLERAQGSAELGDFAAESLWLKARCLQRMGRRPEALAYLRMLGDFHGDSPYADSLPAEVVEELAALPLVAAQQVARSLEAPPGLDVPRVYYSRIADRYRLTGRVRVLYSVEPDGHTAGLRVVESAHPLLDGWALQALADAKIKDEKKKPRASERAATGFLFSSKWEEDDEGESWIVFFPER